MRAQPVTEFLRFSQLDLREVRARRAAHTGRFRTKERGGRRRKTTTHMRSLS
jgi:hypothetical protein